MREQERAIARKLREEVKEKREKERKVLEEHLQVRRHSAELRKEEQESEMRL